MIPIGATCKTTEQCRQEHEREDLFCERVGLLRHHHRRAGASASGA